MHLQRPGKCVPSSTPRAGRTRPPAARPPGAAGSAAVASVPNQAHPRPPLPLLVALGPALRRGCRTTAPLGWAHLEAGRDGGRTGHKDILPSVGTPHHCPPNTPPAHHSLRAGHRRAPCTCHLEMAGGAVHQKGPSTLCQLPAAERRQRDGAWLAVPLLGDGTASACALGVWGLSSSAPPSHSSHEEPSRGDVPPPPRNSSLNTW